MAKNQQDSQGKDEQIKALTAAITALSQGQGVIGTQSQINAALAALAQKDTGKAKDLFRKEAERAELATKQGAEAYRNLGALAFLDNTQEALAAYQRATALDPDNFASKKQTALLFVFKIYFISCFPLVFSV
jgi:protein O-GlcNAc transferase